MRRKELGFVVQHASAGLKYKEELCTTSGIQRLDEFD